MSITELVHIYHVDAPEQLIGCGAMVEGGYIATCRHVWQDAGGDKRESVMVAFPYALENKKPALRPATLADACETDPDEPDVDLVLLRVADTPAKLRGAGLKITRDADFESGDAYAFAWIGTKEKNVPVDGRIASVVDDEGLRNFGVNEPEGYWLEKGSSGSPVILKNLPKLAGLVSIADVEGDQKDVKLREAFIVPGTIIWRFVSAAQAGPVAEREKVDIDKLRDLLANLGHDNVPAGEIPAKLEESLKALRAQGEKQAAPSNAGADIDATIAAARAKLRESDPQGALALLRAKRAEETQARVKRETALLAEEAEIERRAYDYAGAKATLEELLGLDPDAVWRWIDLGELWQMTGNLAEASRAFHAALDAARRLGLARDEALALERLGGVLDQQGKLTDALQSYQAQLAIVERLAKADPDNTMGQRDLSVSYNKIGNILSSQGKLTDALRSFSDGLAIVERLAKADPNNTQWQYDLGFSNERIGDVLVAQGNLAGAMKSYRARHEIITHLAKADPNNAQWQRDLSVSYNKIGSVLVQQGTPTEAQQSFRHGLAIIEHLALVDPDNTQWQYDLGVLNERIGDVLLAQGDLAGAMKSYRARHEIITHLAKADPNNAQWRRDLSVSYNKIGNVLVQQGKPAESLQSFRDGLAIIEHLALADPNNARWQYDLGFSNERVGVALVAQGDLAGAMKSYRASHEIITHLAKADPNNAQWQFDLGVSNERIGDVLLAQGDLAGAVKSYRARHEIISHLAKADPNNAQWQCDLAISNERIGDMLVKQNDAKGAIEAFERALGAYRKLLESNPDDVQARLFSVVPHWRLSSLDKAKAREHLEAALAILEPMAAQDRLDANRCGWIGKIKAQLAALDDPAA
jgi:tetratricopeptide (TPR) repeat protein